jgi:LysM repeat protein
MWRRWFYLFGVIGVLALLLVGCDLSRPADAVGDIDAFVPPAEVAAQVSPPAVEFQTDNTVIRLQPATQQLKVGEMGNVQIVIDNVANLMGVEIELQFAPNIIQIQDTDPNKEGIQIQPGDFLSPDFVKSNIADNTTGKISYILVQVPPTSPVSGSGVLATITFQAVSQGSSDLTLSIVKLADSEARPISATIQSGQVTVDGDPSQPTPTFTATFTPIPGQPTLTPTLTITPTIETPTPIPPTATPTLSPTLTPLPTPTSTSIPPQTVVPPDAAVGFCYRVQEGDTLYSLAQKFGLDAQCISLVNELYPPGYIFTHQALFIPEQYGYGPKVYIVDTNDTTLTSIAEQCRLPVSFLASVNDLAESAILQPGHVVEIPLPPFPPPSRFSYPPPGAPSAFPPPGPIPPARPGRCDYIVQPGDTLYSIGRRYGLSVDALARTNGLSNPNYIYVGQCLVFP